MNGFCLFVENQESALAKAASTSNGLPRLVYADWLEENGWPLEGYVMRLSTVNHITHRLPAKRGPGSGDYWSGLVETYHGECKLTIESEQKGVRQVWILDCNPWDERNPFTWYRSNVGSWPGGSYSRQQIPEEVREYATEPLRVLQQELVAAHPTGSSERKFRGERKPTPTDFLGVVTYRGKQYRAYKRSGDEDRFMPVRLQTIRLEPVDKGRVIFVQRSELEGA